MSLADTLLHATRIALVASDAGRNIQRSYVIERSVDLFGFHLVDYRWGRAGTRGQGRRAVFRHEADALGFVRQLLQRRDTAERRIGTPYRPAGGDAGAAVQASSVAARPSHIAPAAQVSLEAHKRMVAELRYRLMSYGLAVASGGSGKVEVCVWGSCPGEVAAIFAEAGGRQRPAPDRLQLTYAEATALADRLDVEAPKKVYPGQGYRPRPRRGSPVSEAGGAGWPCARKQT